MEFSARLLMGVNEPNPPSLEEKRQKLKDAVSQIIESLSPERLKELAKDVSILERAILSIEPEKDPRRDARALLSGNYSNPDDLHIKLVAELKQIAGGMINIVPELQTDNLLNDIPGVYSCIRYGGQLGKGNDTSKFRLEDEKTILRIIKNMNL